MVKKLVLNANRTFTADLGNLREILHWIRENLRHSKLEESDLQKLELSCEEALVNIILHGYKEKPGSIEIVVEVAKQVKVTLIDCGPPFNPLEQDISFDENATLEERRPGGMGLLFIRQYVDDLLYMRDRNKNILTLIKSAQQS